MLNIKNLILIALFLLVQPLVFGQCQQYNLSISYDKQLVHVTSELSHNGVYSYKGIWYSDSIAVDQNKHIQNTSSSSWKCLIIKYDNSGNVVNQINLVLPPPNSSPNLRLDPSTGGLVYILAVNSKNYQINSTLSVQAIDKSVIGIVCIDSNLNNIQFVKIAESPKYQSMREGENDIYCTKTGATMSVFVNKKLYLNNGDSIIPSTALDIYSFQLDTKFNVVQKVLLAQPDNNILGQGMLNTPHGFYYFLKYYKSINVPATSQFYSNTVRKLNPTLGVDGWDFLIIKQVNNQIVSSYTIGFPSGVRTVGGQSNFYYANNRFYFPHFNLGQQVYDNNMQMLQSPMSGRNSLAIFDTAFHITRLKTMIDKSINTNIGMGLFKSSNNEITLIANSDSTFDFNGKSYAPQINTDPTNLNVFFSVVGDSIQYLRSQNTVNYKCFFTDFSAQSAIFNLNPYPGKIITSTNNMILKKPLFNENFWMVKVCLPSLQSKEIEKNIPPSCYPNPINEGVLHVDAAQTIQSIVVMNMQGQVVFEQSPNASKTVLELKNLPVGNYLVRTHLANNVNIQKIIVLH
jgi:hypothetical protein